MDIHSDQDGLQNDVINKAIGTPIAKYTCSLEKRIGWGMLGLVCFMGGVFLCLIKWFNPNVAFTTALQSRIMGFVLIGFGSYLIYNACKSHRLFVITGTDGIALIENRSVQTCRWDEIATVWQKRQEGTGEKLAPVVFASEAKDNRQFIVETKYGEKLVFSNLLSDLSQLGQQIQRATIPYMLPPLKASLENGEKIHFGPLTIDSHALIVKTDQVISWSGVKGLKNDNSILTMILSGKEFSWHLEEIPNYHILLSLIESCQLLSINIELPGEIERKPKDILGILVLIFVPTGLLVIGIGHYLGWWK